jgi:hypothetical protein
MMVRTSSHDYKGSAWPVFDAAGVHENSRLANVTLLIKDDTDSWFYSFLRKYPAEGPRPTYEEFKRLLLRSTKVAK